MRRLLAALALTALAACASAPTPSAGGWTAGYDPATSVASATQREPGGAVSAMFTCRAPNGDLIIRDYTLTGSGQARVTVGTLSVEVPSRRNDGALEIPLRQSPPLLSAAVPGAPMTVAVGGQRHALAYGAAEKLREVAYNCWPQGS